MFNFLKKYKPINEYGDDWSLVRGLHNGSPVVTRFCSSLKDACGHPDYPFQIGVAIPLVGPTDEGLPTDEEAETLGDIEDKLTNLLKDDAIHVASISTGGMRELVFYANKWEPEVFEKLVENANKDYPSHTLQFMMQHDPKWQTFKNLI